MKHARSVRLYNVLFPIWFLMYLFPSWIPLAVLLFNFAFDSLVLALVARWQKTGDIRRLWKQTILRIWLLGFAADILGALLNLAVYFVIAALTELGGGWAETLYGLWNPLNFPGATVFAIPGTVLAGVLIYWFDRRFAFRRTSLSAETVSRLCLVLAVATTPYTMLIPLYIW